MERRVRVKCFKDEKRPRAWLTEQRVSGYAQSLLVIERFGYLDFLLASAEELIGVQYAGRPHLRPLGRSARLRTKNEASIPELHYGAP